jgi:hypothetical protein
MFNRDVRDTDRDDDDTAHTPEPAATKTNGAPDPTSAVPVQVVETTDGSAALSGPLSRSSELRTAGHICEHCGRLHPRGRFMLGCPGPRKTNGLRAVKFLEQLKADAGEVLRERRDALQRDLGGDLGLVKGDTADAYLVTVLLATSLAENLLVKGVLTPKGKSRAAMTAYLQVLDRQVKLGTLLGLERRVKPVDPFVAIQRAVEEANRDRR